MYTPNARGSRKAAGHECPFAGFSIEKPGGTGNASNKLRDNHLESSSRRFLFLAMMLLALQQPLCQAQSLGQPVSDPPPFGTYFSLVHSNWPAFPYLPFDVPVFSLGTID